MGYTWSFAEVLSYWQLWLKAVLGTFSLGLLSIVLGTLVGLVLFGGMRSHFRVIRWPSKVGIDILRAIPALVLLAITYFCLPPFGEARLGAFQVAVIALGFNLAPFVAEVVRAGVESVPTIQYESARTLGFRGAGLWYYIIGPQAIRRMLPPLAGQYITTFKLTALAATIGVPEVWNLASQVITATARPLEARVFAAGLYVFMILPPLVLMRMLERKFEVTGLGAGEER